MPFISRLWFVATRGRFPHLALSMILTGAVAFAITAYAGYRGLRCIGLQTEQRRVAEVTLDLLNETMAALVDLEAGLRGFMLSGREDSLEPYLRAKFELPTLYPALIAQLEREVEPVPTLAATRERLDDLIRRRLDIADSHVAARRRMTQDPRLSDVSDMSDLNGKAVMDEIRASFDALTRLHLERVDRRAYLAAKVQDWATFIMVALAVGGTSLILGAVWLLRREQRVRDRAEALLREFSRSLESMVAQRTQEAREAHDRIQSFAFELDESIETERRRLAREVHDQFGQIFTGMKMLVHEMSRAHPELPRTTVTQLSGLLDESVTMARRIANELRPPLLDDLGLAAAVTHYAQGRSLPGILDIEAEIEDDESLDPHQANQLFRILQEATTNVFRHAQATCVHITGMLSEGFYELRVSDNGRGPQEIRPDASGLRNMRERAAMVSGSLEFSPGIRGGADVVVRFPLRVEELA